MACAWLHSDCRCATRASHRIAPGRYHQARLALSAARLHLPQLPARHLHLLPLIESTIAAVTATAMEVLFTVTAASWPCSLAHLLFPSL